MKKITIILAIIMAFVLSKSNTESIIIPNNAIRVRIIANSNEQKDLNIKEQLRNDIEPKIYKLLKNTTDLNEARSILQNNIENIDIEVSSSLKKQNSNETYKINYGMNYFPRKEFKGVVYAEGNYESLVITLGKGEGNNWWCVLYPPLCMLEFDDVEKENIDYKSFVVEMIKKYLNN